MICIIFAPPRTGKTCLMTHFLNQAMYDRQRNRQMQLELLSKVENGFINIKTIPEHCVSANYTIIGKKFRYTPRVSRFINPYKLGFDNDYVDDVHFNLPYECIGITEAQKYLNSRMSFCFLEWQSRWYEQHGHNNLDIYLDTQRPMLIDVNIRELAHFIEIVKLDIKKDKRGNVIALKWLVRHIENSALFDKYMSSGKKDSTCFIEEIIVADYNVFECYDSQSCKPKFYAGHFYNDIDYIKAQVPNNTREGYINYLKENNEELPKYYFQKRGGK